MRKLDYKNKHLSFILTRNSTIHCQSCGWGCSQYRFGLNNKHQSFLYIYKIFGRYEDEIDSWNFRYSNDNTSFNLIFFFFLICYTLTLPHAIAIEGFSQLENCKHMLIFSFFYQFICWEVAKLDCFLLQYHMELQFQCFRFSQLANCKYMLIFSFGYQFIYWEVAKLDLFPMLPYPVSWPSTLWNKLKLYRSVVRKITLNKDHEGWTSVCLTNQLFKRITRVSFG